MSDQDHLSASHMLAKTVGLLERCGSLAARLQTLMRMRERLLTTVQVRAISDTLAERADVDAMSEEQRDTFARRVAHKADPQPLRQLAEDLAPAAALGVARQLARESRALYEGHVEAARYRSRRTVESALRDAGWIADGKGGFRPPPLPLPSDPPRPQSAGPELELPSVMTHLTAAGADGRAGMDELTAMRLALKHLEATAPDEWKLAHTAERLRRTQGEMNLRHAALQDEVSALRTHLAKLEDKKMRLTAALGVDTADESTRDGEGTAKSPSLTPSQVIRAQLDSLRASSHSTVAEGVRFQSLCHSVVEDMSAAQHEAARLRDQYRRNDAALKSVCAARGIDLDVVMEEGEDGDAEAEYGHAQPSVSGARRAINARTGAQLARDAAGFSATSTAAFRIGLGDRSFPVRFARDGSGRLVHADRAQSALGLLGMHQQSGGADDSAVPSSDHFVDEVTLHGEGATLEWCAAQLLVLRRRMDSRFAGLQSHIDAYRTRVAGLSSRLERGQSARLLRQRMLSLVPLLRSNHAAVQSARADVVGQLREIAARNAQWEARNHCYQRAHREALVLFERLGHRADKALAPH